MTEVLKNKNVSWAIATGVTRSEPVILLGWQKIAISNVPKI